VKGESLTFIFGDNAEFRLDTPRDQPYGHGNKVLSRNGRINKELQPRSLSVLAYLICHQSRRVSRDEIYAQLWPEKEGSDDGRNIPHHISALRTALGDDPSAPRFIDGSPTLGFQFVMGVQRQGDPVGSVDVWSPSRFFEFIQSTEHDEHGAQEDLRFVTTAFSGGVTELKLPRLLKRGVRVSIILMDPKNRELVTARNLLRSREFSVSRATAQIEEQLAELGRLKRDFEKALQVGVSAAMPPGFVAHSRRGALIGALLAQGSYVEGPMSFIPPNTEIWEALHIDWNRRWDDALRHSRTETKP
jgi:DNA-binding winged helix-turn-helix (wHTH) protein